MNRLVTVLLALGLACHVGVLLAQSQAATASTARVDDKNISQWLLRLHDAARQRAYVGTFVVTAGGVLSSARIWHVCEGQQQMERVQALTGPTRTTFRRNDQVMTFLPDKRVVISENRESLGLFPNLLNRADSSIAKYYSLQSWGHERVAGLEADVVQLVPVDTLRFGYRLWTEQSTGLVVKLQTLDHANTVVEQAAFSDLQLGDSVSMAKLSAQMDNIEGYQVRKPNLVKTTAQQEGWQFTGQVAGFSPMSCHKRASADASAKNHDTLQWVFSDGLASVSLFIESFDAARHNKFAQQNTFAMGATHMLTRHLGPWWLTVVGEVPAPTLAVFAQGLERKK